MAGAVRPGKCYPVWKVATVLLVKCSGASPVCQIYWFFKIEMMWQLLFFEKKNLWAGSDSWISNFSHPCRSFQLYHPFGIHHILTYILNLFFLYPYWISLEIIASEIETAFSTKLYILEPQLLFCLKQKFNKHWLLTDRTKATMQRNCHTKPFISVLIVHRLIKV